MLKRNKFFTFLILCIAFSAIFYLHAQDKVLNWWENITQKRGTGVFYELSASSDGYIWNMGLRNENYLLSCANGEKNLWTTSLDKNSFSENFTVESLYACSKDEAFLIGCEYGEKSKPQNRSLYLLKNQGKEVVRLLCDDLKEDIVYGSFSNFNDKVYFPVWKYGSCYIYSYSAELKMLCSFSCPSMKTALVLEDNRIILCQENSLVSLYSDQGQFLYDLQISGNITKFYQGSNSFFYLDPSENIINEISYSENNYYLLQKISVNSNNSLSITPAAVVFYLEKGNLYRYFGTLEDLSDNLYENPIRSGIFLGLYALGIILQSLILSLIFNGKKQISILLRMGLIMFILFGLILGFIFSYGNLAASSMITERFQQNIDSVAGLGLRFSAKSLDNTALYVKEALADSGFTNAKATLYRYSKEGYEVLDSTDSSKEKGSIVLGNEMLLNAPSSGIISKLSQNLNGKESHSVATDGIYLMEIICNISLSRFDASSKLQKIYQIILYFVLAFFAIIGFLILKLCLNLKNIKKSAYKISGGDYSHSFTCNTGDELEGLTLALNNMALSLDKTDHQNKSLENKYTRFILNDLLKLMNINSPVEASKENTASLKMAVVTLAFKHSDAENLPVSIGSISTSIYPVLQRLNGKILEISDYNFIYGFNTEDRSNALELARSIMEIVKAYNTVLEDNYEQKVEAALAIDYGTVDIKIFGNDYHMFPKIISKCKDRNEKVISLCHKLNSKILITESFKDFLKEEDFRYAGQYQPSAYDDSFNLYEVFAEDSFLLTQRKKDTKKEMEEAVKAFYQWDFSASKKVFIKLIRSGSANDGIACYYLHLADEYETKAPDYLSL